MRMSVCAGWVFLVVFLSFTGINSQGQALRTVARFDSIGAYYFSYKGFYFRDINGDGRQDMYILGEKWPVVGYNNGQNQFTRGIDTLRHPFMDSLYIHVGISVSWVRLDKDSLLDMAVLASRLRGPYVERWWFFRQTSSGQFDTLPSMDHRRGSFMDLDQDGDEDYVVSDSSKLYLRRNTNGRFAADSFLVAWPDAPGGRLPLFMYPSQSGRMQQIFGCDCPANEMWRAVPGPTGYTYPKGRREIGALDEGQADFDGDGIMELFGGGRYIFVRPDTLLSSSLQRGSIYFGSDLDHDGRAEAIMKSNDSVFVVRIDGPGQSRRLALIDKDVRNNVGNVWPIDANGDTLPDLGFEYLDKVIYIRENLGGFHFGPAKSFSINSSLPVGAIPAVNGRGEHGAVVGTETDVYWYTTTATGGDSLRHLAGPFFPQSPKYPDSEAYEVRLADVDNDGTQDWIATGPRRNYWGHTDGTGGAHPWPGIAKAIDNHEALIADVNGDGRNELFYRDSSTLMQMTHWQAGGGYEPGKPAGVRIWAGILLSDLPFRAIEDIDGDGLKDFAYDTASLTWQRGYRYHRGKPDGTFSETPEIQPVVLRSNFYREQLSDFNADGRWDLLKRDSLNRILYAYQVGRTAFQNVYTGVTGRIYAPQFHDFDRNGLPDALFAHTLHTPMDSVYLIHSLPGNQLRKQAIAVNFGSPDLVGAAMPDRAGNFPIFLAGNLDSRNQGTLYALGQSVALAAKPPIGHDSPVKLTPNPASASVTISVSIGCRSANLTNVTGQILSRFDLSNGQTTIQLKDVPPGLYLIQVPGHRPARLIVE